MPNRDRNDHDDGHCTGGCAEVAVLQNEVSHLRNEKDLIDDRVKILEVDRVQRDQMTARIKGGAAVMVALASFVATLLAKWDAIKSFVFG